MDLFSAQIAHASLNGFIASVDAKIINPLISFLFALAVVFFLYGVFEFIANQENEEKKTTGKQHMLWGIIGITIMLGTFMIMNTILSTLGITGIDPEQGTVILQ
jgi:uncharacterized membrane protein YidH (DUF202 family)